MCAHLTSWTVGGAPWEPYMASWNESAKAWPIITCGTSGVMAFRRYLMQLYTLFHDLLYLESDGRVEYRMSKCSLQEAQSPGMYHPS